MRKLILPLLLISLAGCRDVSKNFKDSSDGDDKAESSAEYSISNEELRISIPNSLTGGDYLYAPTICAQFSKALEGVVSLDKLYLVEPAIGRAFRDVTDIAVVEDLKRSGTELCFYVDIKDSSRKAHLPEAFSLQVEFSVSQTSFKIRGEKQFQKSEMNLAPVPSVKPYVPTPTEPTQEQLATMPFSLYSDCAVLLNYPSKLIVTRKNRDSLLQYEVVMQVYEYEDKNCEGNPSTLATYFSELFSKDSPRDEWLAFKRMNSFTPQNENLSSLLNEFNVCGLRGEWAVGKTVNTSFCDLDTLFPEGSGSTLQEAKLRLFQTLAFPIEILTVEGLLEAGKEEQEIRLIDKTIKLRK